MQTLLETKELTIGIGRRIFGKPLNFSIHPHERWGILGANGSGKTTLLHTFSGLIKSLSGQVFLKNHDLKNLSCKEIARHIGILLQNTSDNFPQTVYDYCAMARFPHLKDFTHQEHQLIIQQALEVMELATFSTKKISTLSGGERKRLAIAALLTQSPQLFLLDEPMNHLDIYYQIKILHFFKQLSFTQPISVIMSLHDINLAEMFCDKLILIFKNGQWLAGETKKLLTSDHLQQVYQHPIKKKDAAWLPYYEE